MIKINNLGINRMNKETINKFAQTATLMMLFTLISKLLGFVREIVTAGIYGTSYVTDAYVMAQTIPTIVLGGILAALGTAYMPLLARVTENEGEEKGKLFTSNLITALLILSAIFVLVGNLFSEQLVGIFAYGFSSEAKVLTSSYLKITFMYIFFTSTAAIFETYLQYKGHFLTQIAAGYAQNIIVIAMTVVSAYTSNYLLVFGLLFGNAARCFIICGKTKKIGFSYIKSLKIKESFVMVVTFAIPVFIGTYIQQINTFVDKSLASTLGEGSVSALYYANLLINLTVTLTVSVISTLIYPELAKSASQRNIEKLHISAQKGIDLICIIAIPCSLGIIAYNELIVQIIYERGAFGEFGTELTASALSLYGIGLLFLGLNNFLVRIFYALEDMKTPMILAAISVCVNITMNFILIGPLQHRGLALGTSIAYMTYSVLMLAVINRKNESLELFSNRKKIVKVLIGAFCAVLIPYKVYVLIFKDNLAAIVSLGVAVVLTGILYIIFLYGLKIEEVAMLKSLIIRRSSGDDKNEQ